MRSRQFSDALSSFNPINFVIDEMLTRQAERNAVVSEMFAQIQDAEPDVELPLRNQIPGGMA